MTDTFGAFVGALGWMSMLLPIVDSRWCLHFATLSCLLEYMGSLSVVKRNPLAFGLQNVFTMNGSHRFVTEGRNRLCDSILSAKIFLCMILYSQVIGSIFVKSISIYWDLCLLILWSRDSVGCWSSLTWYCKLLLLTFVDIPVSCSFVGKIKMWEYSYGCIKKIPLFLYMETVVVWYEIFPIIIKNM